MNKLVLTAFLLVLLIRTIVAQTTVQLTPSLDNSIFSDITSNSNGLGELFSGEICNGGHQRALMQFDLSGLPCGASVTSVTLTLVVDQVSPNITASNYTLNELLKAWGEGTSSGSGQGSPAVAPDATWNDAMFGTSQWTTAGGDFNAASTTTTMTAATGTQTFSSTSTLVSDVQGWINNPATNFGWILIGDEAIQCTARRFGSKDGGTAPVLEITYTLPSASFNYSASSFCANGNDPSPTITGTPGGTFSSTPAGLSLDHNTGWFDVSASTPGTYTVTYTAPGGCSISTNQSVTINAVSNSSFNYGASSYCVTAADPTPTITGLAGGTFSSSPSGLSLNTSTGTITLNTSTPGTYNVTYAVTGTCPGSTSHSVTIGVLSNASFNYSASSYCTNAADPTPTITGTPGGTFSSTPSGLSLNSNTGKITLGTSTPGTYNLTYAFSGPCPTSESHSVTINALSNANFNYSSAFYCLASADPTPTITGIAGGTFTSTPPGLVINSSTGTIDVSASALTTYNVTYSVMGSCPNSFSQSVVVINTASADFSYSADTFCVFDPNPLPIITGQSGGIFSANPAGLILDPATGWIDLSSSLQGSYTVTYTISGACSSVSTSSFTINPISNADFAYSSTTFCSNSPNETPIISGLAGGLFTSSPPGLVLDSVTGIIQTNVSTQGTYNVTYTTISACPNSTTQPVAITAIDTTVILNFHTLTSYESNASYQWIYCSNLNPVPGAIYQSFMATTTGYYALILNKHGCVDTSICYEVLFVNINDYSNYNNINIFPNPTTGKVFVQLNNYHETIDVTIKDFLGNTIDDIKFSATDKFQFSLNAPSGIYFLEINTSRNQVFYLKVLKD